MFHSCNGDILKAIPAGTLFEVSMCNPPFYDTETEAEPTVKPSIPTNFSGVPSELSFPGGELLFLKRYILESWGIRSQARWFTSLIGVKRHVEEVGRYLRTQFPGVVVEVKTFKQGRTWRWGVAWRFGEG